MCRWDTSYRPRAPGCMIGAKPMLWRLTSGHSRSRSSAEATEARAENLFQAYLDPYPGMGLKIQQPGRRMIAPSVGGHHDQPFAIFEVDKGGGSRFTASSPCGRQEQSPASHYPRADESSRVAVDELMELEVGNLQRGRGGITHSSAFSLVDVRQSPMMIVPRTSLSGTASAVVLFVSLEHRDCVLQSKHGGRTGQGRDVVPTPRSVPPSLW